MANINDLYKMFGLENTPLAKAANTAVSDVSTAYANGGAPAAVGQFARNSARALSDAMGMPLRGLNENIDPYVSAAKTAVTGKPSPLPDYGPLIRSDSMIASPTTTAPSVTSSQAAALERLASNPPTATMVLPAQRAAAPAAAAPVARTGGGGVGGGGAPRAPAADSQATSDLHLISQNNPYSIDRDGYEKWNEFASAQYDARQRQAARDTEHYLTTKLPGTGGTTLAQYDQQTPELQKMLGLAAQEWSQRYGYNVQAGSARYTADRMRPGTVFDQIASHSLNTLLGSKEYAGASDSQRIQMLSGLLTQYGSARTSHVAAGGITAQGGLNAMLRQLANDPGVDGSRAAAAQAAYIQLVNQGVDPGSASAQVLQTLYAPQ